MPDELLHLIQKVQQRLREGRYQNESDVREAIVLPVLRALGWDADDPGTLRREFPIQQVRVDYALCVDGRDPSLLIEVKSVGSAREGDQQLFQYLFHHGTPMAVLADGQEWDFYLPTATGSSYDDRRVQRLDLLARETDECCRVLERYLDQARVRSGEALRDAQRDHQDNRLRKKARATLPQAWQALLEEQDGLLVDLLVEKTEGICGSRPEKDDVEVFLSSLRSEPASPPIPPQPIKGPLTKPARYAKRPTGIEIVFDGKTEAVPTAIAGLISIIEHLAKRDPTFLPRLATRAKGTKVNYVARRREDVYPGRPDRQDLTHPIGGWYLATNISNAVKQTILKRVCDVAGLRYGKDVALLIPE